MVVICDLSPYPTVAFGDTPRMPGLTVYTITPYFPRAMWDGISLRCSVYYIPKRTFVSREGGPNPPSVGGEGARAQSGKFRGQ